MTQKKHIYEIKVKTII